MNKAELIEQASEISGLSKEVIRKALDSTISTITQVLKNGNRVSIKNFASFSIRTRAERRGRNPQTGKEIKIASKREVKFRANCPGPH
jgi:DNA-binding protein HU-beta